MFVSVQIYLMFNNRYQIRLVSICSDCCSSVNHEMAPHSSYCVTFHCFKIHIFIHNEILQLVNYPLKWRINRTGMFKYNWIGISNIHNILLQMLLYDITAPHLSLGAFLFFLFSFVVLCCVVCAGHHLQIHLGPEEQQLILNVKSMLCPVVLSHNLIIHNHSPQSSNSTPDWLSRLSRIYNSYYFIYLQSHGVS